MNAFLDWARRKRWQVELPEEEREMPKEAFCRYGKLPPDYEKFLRHINVLANEADTSWFLSIDDFVNNAKDAVWSARSFEEISLEAASGDNDLETAVAQFWDAHIPIVFCLANGYEYYAIRLADGAVVNGIEPEFEEVSVVSSSFEDFLAKTIAGKIVL
ncbi:MAG: SMI1/KNR4 family protein [Christensenellaceae bacterium]